MSSTQLQQANGKSKKDNCTALPDAGKQGTTPAETIVQTLPQRSNGRCYFLHPTEYRIRTHRLTASPTNPQHVRVEGRYTGEWTIDCEKHHVHTKSCKPQHATGFGRLTYEIAGRKFVEEGHFHRGLLDTGSDSSDSEVDYDAADEEEDEPYVSAPAASSSKPSEDKEKKGDDDEKKETASDVAVTTSGAGERAGVSKKRPHSPAADDTKAKKTKKSSGAPASKPKVEKAKAADDSTPFQDRSSAASKSAKLREAAASSSACVFKRYDPPASSTASAQHRRPHSISVQDALQYEAAASKAAEARANGKRSKVPWGRDGWTYRGAMKGDKRHGFGTCTYDTGSVFQGEYVNDRSSGFGVWRDWINDVRLEYEGGWLEDQEHGVGKLTTINSDIGKFTAKGTWNHGEMEGEGTWTLASGHVYYKGLFHHGNFSRGLLHSIDPPRRYEGEFLNQQFSGHGCMQWTNNSSGDSPEGSVYLYGTFVRHDPFGPGIIITTHCPSSSAGSERFQIFPAVYKGEMVYARWIRKEGVEGKKKDEAEQESKMDTSEEVAAAAPSAEQDDDSAVVWDYLRQLISDGLEAVNRMQANPLSDADIQHVIDEKLSSYISSSDFHLISLPNSIFNGERQGVCAYKISDQVGCANQPYICHTCSKGRKVPLEVCAACAQSTECHSGHSLTPLAATRDFVCDCGDRHGTPTHQPADHAEERKESDMADDDADGIDLYECHGMMSSTERVYQLIHPMPKFISQWVRQQNEMQKAKEAAAAETPAAAPKAASKSAKAATKAATKTASKGAPAWMPKPKSTSKPSSKSILKAETAAAADPAAADAKKQD